MNSEPEQPAPAAPDQGGRAAESKSGAGVAAAGAKAGATRRAGVPVWRTGKPDAFLAAAVDTARDAVQGITPAATIGRHLGAKSEGDRLVTHLFESRLPGYVGWQWYAVLTRNSRSKVVTVNELGLLPSEESILAPEWVPWAERVRPEDEQDVEQVQEVAAPDEARPGEAAPAADPEGAVPAGGSQGAADQDSPDGEPTEQASGDQPAEDDDGTE
ncbi:DUF3027 domain-containing protein [Pseudarthrobacter phenanthrenivorans]|uniref:DUF3027 domain-containing protein n=1 Tax=Pseudarthrobacter phenanthrenivorans TaxID=361575 RepID=UPI00112E7294|nr:DUF3027 domain-containing protein [Pseudarthrobacter phenanthrenivorans]TPV49293.1 DUF3027 domain-containing protein [Pseudarthrobacter phenanthrenivorans]